MRAGFTHGKGDSEFTELLIVEVEYKVTVLKHEYSGAEYLRVGVDASSQLFTSLHSCFLQR